MADFNFQDLLVSSQLWIGKAIIWFVAFYTTKKFTKMSDKTIDNIEGGDKYIKIFALLSFLIICISSIINYLRKDDDEEESVGSYLVSLPKFLLVLIWYVFILIALTYKLISKGKESSSSTSTSTSNTTIGKGPISLTISSDQFNSSINVIVFMAIFITIINIFSNLYVYYMCNDDGCEKDEVVKSLVSGQWEILFIGIVAVGVFILKR